MNGTKRPARSSIACGVNAAATLSSRHQPSFWDAMINRSAAELLCNTSWTEDLNDGQVIEGVQLANPLRRG